MCAFLGKCLFPLIEGKNKKKLEKAFREVRIKGVYLSHYFGVMKKQDFIKAVAASAGLSQDAVAKVLGAAIEVITDEVSNGGEVNITGFGVFKVAERAARNGVNPRTGEAISIPAMKSPVFRAGKTFKEAVR